MKTKTSKRCFAGTAVRWVQAGAIALCDIALFFTVVVGIKCYCAFTFDLYWRHASQQENKTENRCVIHSFQNSGTLSFCYNYSVLVWCCLLAPLFSIGEWIAWSLMVCNLATSYWLLSVACYYLSNHNPHNCGGPMRNISHHCKAKVRS